MHSLIYFLFHMFCIITRRMPNILVHQTENSCYKLFTSDTCKNTFLTRLRERLIRTLLALRLESELLVHLLILRESPILSQTFQVRYISSFVWGKKTPHTLSQSKINFAGRINRMPVDITEVNFGQPN